MHPNDRRPRRLAVTALLGLIALAAVLLVVARAVVPREITFYAGAAGTTSYVTAERYRDALREHGVTLRLVETAGAIENLRILSNPDTDPASASIVQTGIENVIEETLDLTGVASLGTMYVEPFWFFVRSGSGIDREHDLVGRLVVPGAEGSSIRAVTEAMLAANGISPERIGAWLDEVPEDEVHDALRDSTADAAFMLGLPNTPLIEELLRADGIEVLGFRRAAAYALQYRSLEAVTLPEGGFDLAANIPAADVDLLAATSQLVVREDIPGVMADVLLDAATEVHRDATLFTERGEYPSAAHGTFPIVAAAERFYRDGPSITRRLFPFWVATLLNRTALVLAAAAAATVAAVQILPKLILLPFTLAQRSILRRLADIERESGEGTPYAELDERIQALTREAQALDVPPLAVGDYNDLCQIIFDTSERLAVRKRRAAEAHAGNVGT